MGTYCKFVLCREQPVEAPADVQYHMPRGPNLAGPDGAAVATEAVATGLQALPHLAEIYPLGGELHITRASAL